MCKKWYFICRDFYVSRHQILRGTVQMQDADVMKLVNYAPSLGGLDLTKCCLLTSAGLAECLPYAPNLRRLYLKR